MARRHHFRFRSRLRFARTKWLALVVAIVFNYTIHRRVVLSGNASPPLAVCVAAVSLVLWVSVVAGGLFIAFVSQ